MFGGIHPFDKKHINLKMKKRKFRNKKSQKVTLEASLDVLGGFGGALGPFLDTSGAILTDFCQILASF